MRTIVASRDSFDHSTERSGCALQFNRSANHKKNPPEIHSDGLLEYSD